MKLASIEKRGDAYRIVTSCGYGTDGKKIRKSMTWMPDPGMTTRQIEKELQRRAVLFEEQVQTGQYLDADKLTFADFTQKWLSEYADRQLAPGTLRNMRMRIEKRILPALGHLKLKKIQPHHLLEFYNNLSKTGVRFDTLYTPSKTLLKRVEPMSTSEIVKISGITIKTAQRIKNGSPTNFETAQKLCAALGLDMKKAFEADTSRKLSDKTIRHHHGIIHNILETAVKWNMIQYNPASRVDLGKLSKYKPAYYDDEQVVVMLESLENESLMNKAMVYLVIDTGIRSGELTGLVWSDIDLDKGRIAVNKQRLYISTVGEIVSSPKTESGNRTITMSERVTALLRQYRVQQIENGFQLGTAWQETDYVFIHPDGKPISPQYPNKWFDRFLQRHDLPKITFHQLRHTNASLLIAAGVDIVTLSGRLGHADRGVTLNVYSHIIKSKEAETANKMDVFYAKVRQSETKTQKA